MPNFADPKAAKDYGYDFNFFQKIVVTAGTFNTDCDVLINMKAPTYTVTFQLEAGGPVQYSFNGNTVHGDMQAGTVGLITSNSLTFTNRTISKIWFKGSGTVRIEAWAIR